MSTRVTHAPYQRSRVPAVSAGALRCRRKFLRFFAGGFKDEKYVAWERGYKQKAAEQWGELLHRAAYRALLREGAFAEIAAHAVRIESRTNLLFSFEKMALRDALRTPAGAQSFATGLYDFLHGTAAMERRFERWCAALAALPVRQTRVFTWPVATVFGFLAQPDTQVFLKPKVTRVAATAYGFDFDYQPRPAWETYADLLRFAATVRRDLSDLRPRDLIDIQSFLWVQGSEEYAE